MRQFNILEHVHVDEVVQIRRDMSYPPPAAFIFIFITVALDMLALGIIIPVLPKLIESFVGGNTVRAAEMVGIFGTAWAIMQFLFSPAMGSLSDRFGRRPIVLLSNWDWASIIF